MPGVRQDQSTPHRWPYDEKAAALYLPVAAIALTVDSEPSTNRNRLVKVVRRDKAAHPDLRLVLFGEVTLGWFTKGKETESYYERIAETIPGPTMKAVASVARELGVHISYGMVERHDRGLSNTQVVIDPGGQLLATYRMVNLRLKFLTPGPRRAQVFEIDGVRCTIMICYDMQSFLLGREIHRARPEVILFSVADDERTWFAAQHTAARFDAWIVCANRYGEESGWMWPGQIFVSDPLGRIRAGSLGGEKVLYYRIPIVRKHGPIARGVRRTFITVRLALIILANVHGAWGFAVNRVRVLMRRRRRKPKKL
ncbi:MAG: carbon-nitrogen hydrolase family protein [Candidatus Bipolaricaulis sp.]|nr:carbon-nitrogen hydrolase family protein [Candidatus Bipolaricaulis sp.]